MANKKYTELPQANAITGAEILAMVQDGGSVQGDIDLIKAYFDTVYSVYTAPASVTPTFTGFGTVSGVTAYTWRMGAMLHFEIRFTAGTPSGTEARIGLRYNPGGGEVDVTSASNYPTLQASGLFLKSSTTGNCYTLIEASKTYLTVGLQSEGTNAGLNKVFGNAAVTASESVSMVGSVRIQGW